MYPCSFEYENTRFMSSEQCFQFNRARTNNNLKSAQRIITDDPFVCKQIGNSLEDSEEWAKEAETSMLDINRLKFEHNPYLIDLLLATGDSTLQEATTSNKWGIGASIRSKSARDNTASGENTLGKVLMQLRSEFAACRDTSQSDQSDLSQERDFPTSHNAPLQLYSRLIISI